MLPAWFIIIAVAIRLISGAAYATAVVKGKAHPNPITWFFWGLTAMIVFVAQVLEGAGWNSVMTFALALGPLVIFLLSLKHNWSYAHFTPANVTCAVFAGLGIIFWQITSDPVLAIVFSIMADIFGSIPTIIKSYVAPASEVAVPYLLSMLSMVITLFTLTEWTFITYAFPIYIFMINFVIFGVLVSRAGPRAVFALPAK